MKKITIRGLHPMTGEWVILCLEDVEKDTSEEDTNRYLLKLSKFIEDTTNIDPNQVSFVTMQAGKKHVTFDPRKFLSVEVYVEDYFVVEKLKR